MDANAKTEMGLEVGLLCNHDEHMKGKLKQHYKVEHVRDGKIIGVDEFDNLITTAGLNQYLSAALTTGLASPAWYVGLIGATDTLNAADTMASHAGWTEITPYSNATKPAWTGGTVSAGSVSNSASVAAFTINASSTVYGCFLCSNSALSATTGTLLGEGVFGASRAVLSGDTLNVTITCSLT